ncbi:hypothetical protein BP5796_07561 [Coleophoma crateriformis]|uniref:Protein BIG1 n=1 Tax=Coleophoma crateriformis TaxID=565419 RepID=A0A3D8RJ94_9HELO|nr:hypothetical protein BP5796_07561 [Coleophoma crateriformis]
MRLSTAITIAAGVATADAFKNTSPFLLFSSSTLPSSVSPFSTNQLQSASDVLQSTSDFLAACPSHLYVIASQPQVAASDLAPRTSVPFLRRLIADPSVKTKNLISEVVGSDETLVSKQLLETIVAKCNAEIYDSEKFANGQWPTLENGKQVIIMTSFEALPAEKKQRERQLSDNDAALFKFVEQLPKESYTVIYTTSPVTSIIEESSPYDPVFQEAFHMDLKRDLTGSKKTNSTRDPRPLFEKYNFFSSGLFMGLLTTFFLLSILGVGLKALTSLQVSYGAFDKEMGPAAHKKQ